MHAGRQEAPLSCARDEGDEGDEARLRGCLTSFLPLEVLDWLYVYGMGLLCYSVMTRTGVGLVDLPYLYGR